MAKKSVEAMKQTVSKLYRAVSKVTAEIPDAKGRPQKQAYAGTFTELFSDIDAGNKTITKFIWVITHKVGELSNPLFKRNEKGELIRNSSGFYAYEDQPDGTKKKVHIVGEALVPYLYEWMQSYSTTPREEKPIEASNKEPEYIEAEVAVPKDSIFEVLSKYTTEDLAAELVRRGWVVSYGVI